MPLCSSARGGEPIVNNPWRRSDLTIAVRLLIVILLLGATAFPAREGARRNIQAVALLDPMGSWRR